MAQHDYVIANGTGSAVRSDLNDALAAIVSMNSGSTEPSATFAFQFWADTNANLLKMRNSANDGWIELRQLDGEFTSVSVANGTAAAPSIFFNASGTDTGIYSNGTDSVDVSTGGTRRLDIGSAGDVTVRGGNVTLNAQGDLRLADSDSSNWVAFQAPATVASNVTWTLPSADGTSGQALSTNGSGTLSWSSVGGDKIEEGNTSAEVVDTGSDGHFKVVTEGTEALRVDSSQRVGIGINSPAQNLHIASTGSTTQRISRTGLADGNASDAAVIEFANGTGAVSEIRAGGDGDTQFNVRNLSTNSYTNSLFIQGSTGNVGIGTTSPGAPLSVQANSTAEGIEILGRATDDIGEFAFLENDGTTEIGRIQARTTELNFRARQSGQSITFISGGTTERARIDDTGNFLVGTTTVYSVNSSTATGFYAQTEGPVKIAANAPPLWLLRQDADGTLVSFRRAGVEQGTISVSGTTVSYNGAHLSRWSQLPGGVERTEILRGSVLSNIDEMCDWGEEDNEQLNRMKVSDVEGDRNVSGVFQAWDDDDDTYTNDFYCAMTGDFVIRIAQGVTVERGDLLMSAGDGTAKPQDDDIIRSKTIAKVTSTHVSETYADGSYCVPCVLMAC